MAGVWSNTGNLIAGRSYLAGCGTQDQGLSFGGLPTLNTTEKFDGTVWSNSNPLITGRRQLAGCGTQSQGLSFGGYTSLNVNNTEEYDGTTWSNSNPLITGRRYLAGCGTQSQGLSFGGQTSLSVNNTEKFDGTVWSNTGNLITGRYYLAGCGTQSQGLSFGGLTSLNVNLTSLNVNNTEKFDGTVWSNSNLLNIARGYLAGCGTQNQGLSFGGYNENTGINNTEEYDGTVWSNTGNLITGRYSLAGCGTQSQGLSFGGQISFQQVNNTEKYLDFQINYRELNYNLLFNSTKIITKNFFTNYNISMSSSFNVPSKIVIGDDELLKITSNINLSTNIKNFSSRIKIIKKNINESLQETQRYEYTYQFVNTKNEEFFKKYSQDFFVVQPEIGIVVRYEFLPFIEFFRYVKKDTTFEIHDKQNSSLINLSLKTKPFWQNNNILEIDRFSSTELYLRFQRYIYSIKGSNTPYTESFEETYFSNQEFKYDKELHNKIKDDLENIYFSTLVVVQQKDTQKEMLKRINDSYRNEGNQLIKFLIENVFKIQSLNLNDLETQIVLPILWKQYIITQYQKTLTSNQIQKVIDDYIEMLYMASMDESKIDYITGNNTFNFNLFFNQLRDTNDHFEKSYDPYFYKISFLIDNYNYNSIVLNLYNCNERIQRLYNLTIQVEQFLKGKINFTIFHDLLGEPDVCGRLNENCQLYYIPVGENISKVQEMEYQYSLYNDKLDILNKLYQFENKIYYKKVLIDNTDVDIVTINDIGYYSIKIVESDTSLVFRNIGYLYIGNQQAEYNIYFQENKLYYGETEIGFVDPSIDKFKLFIRKIFLDSIFSSITYLQYIKYDIDYDRIISKEEYNEYEFIRSTDDELIFQLRILKNYKIRKGTLKIYISYTDDDEIILYDNHHGELVFVYPEPNKYIEFITQQYEKLGKMIEKYDKNPEETDNLEYIYQKIYNQITNLNTYLQELLYTTTVYQWEIFDKIRDYLIEQTMNSILLDESTVNSPVRDEEWVTKIIDDNLLSVSQNIQGYIDYDKNELRIDRNLIKYIELDSSDVSLDDVETNLLEAKELEYTDILYSTYNFYDPKIEVHYILNCLLQEYDVYNLYLTLQQKTTRFILNKYILNEINNKTLQELEDINLLTYYRMLVGFTYLTDIQYDAILKTEKNTVFPIVFNKLNQEIFEMNDYNKVIQNLNTTFQNFMKLIELSKLKSLSTNILTDSFSKNRILLSTSNSNIVIKLLDQINTEIKESQFYQQNNYILNEKRDLNINKLSNFKNFTYTNTILSTLKDTNFIEYFIQFNINTFYNMNFFENKSKIINDITKENSLQLLKLEKLEFYVKQASQTFHFEW